MKIEKDMVDIIAKDVENSGIFDLENELVQNLVKKNPAEEVVIPAIKPVVAVKKTGKVVAKKGKKAVVKAVVKGEPKKSGRKPKKAADKVKSIIGRKYDYWAEPQALERVLAYVKGIDAPKTNYEKTEYFLYNNWTNKKTFKVVDLQKALNKEYPECAEYTGSFRIDMGLSSFGSYYVSENKAPKIKNFPCFKKTDQRGVYENMLYKKKEVKKEKK
jgi:hypothetical protein